MLIRENHLDIYRFLGFYYRTKRWYAPLPSSSGLSALFNPRFAQKY